MDEGIITEEQFDINFKSHLEMIILIIVLITTVPIVAKFFFGKKKDEVNEDIDTHG